MNEQNYTLKYYICKSIDKALMFIYKITKTGDTPMRNDCLQAKCRTHYELIDSNNNDKQFNPENKVLTKNEMDKIYNKGVPYNPDNK